MQAQNSSRAIKNIVLVHGAWADGSSWSKVIPLLEAKGFHVVAVHNPLTSLADDVASTKRAIALQDGPVLLVGHSYGGVVITEAGDNPMVAGLVYVAAFAPDRDQSAADLGKGFPTPEGLSELQPDASGFLTISPKGVRKDFAQDLPDSETALLTATQGPTAATALGAKVTTAAWKNKPTWYIVATDDHMISPDLEQKLATRMNAKSITLQTSHVPMLSRPIRVAEFIESAARNPGR